MAYLTTRLLEMDLHDVSIAITLDRSLPLGSAGQGSSMPSPAASDGIGSTLTVKLSRLTVHNAGAESYGVLQTDVKLKGFSVDIDQPSLLREGSGSSKLRNMRLL